MMVFAALYSSCTMRFWGRKRTLPVLCARGVFALNDFGLFRSALFVVVTIPAIFGLRGLRIGSNGAVDIQALAFID
jgi:hypothetical protein